MKKITTLDKLKLPSEYITYNAEFEPVLQHVEKYEFRLDYTRCIYHTMGKNHLPETIRFICNGEVTRQIPVRNRGLRYLKSFGEYEPIVSHYKLNKVLNIFAIPVFKIKPSYLLVDNIVIEYPDEVTSIKPSNNT